MVGGSLLLLTIALRWLMQRGLTPLSQQMIRQLFTERLTATTPRCRLIREDDDALTVQCGEAICTVYFTTLYRRCQEEPHRTVLIVRDAVLAVQAMLEEADDLPDNWMSQVVPLLVNTELATPPDLVLRPFVGSLSVGYVVDHGETLRWLTRRVFEPWSIDEEALHTQAIRNLERSCFALVIETPPPLADGRDRLLRFHTGDGLDAARLLLPDFYQRYSPRFGDVDLVVAIPTRDLLLVIPATDQAQASFLSWRIESERRASAHPLARQLFVVSETGITPWAGGTPVEAG